MKEICKKILSGVLCASLIVTPIMQPNDLQAAESTVATATVESQSTAGEIRFALSEKPVNQLEDKELKFTSEGLDGTILYIRNSTAFNGIGALQTLYPLGEWSGIWLNDAKLESGYTFGTNESAYPVFYAKLESVTLEAGDCMVVRGAWTNGTATYGFHMETVTYEYNGTKWIAVDTPDVVVEEGGSDLAAIVDENTNQGCLYLEYPNMKTALGMDVKSYDELTPIGSSSGIYVDGKKVENVKLHGAGWGDIFYVQHGISSPVVGETTVRIQGIWSYNNKYVSLKTQQFKYTGETPPWALDASYVEETANEVYSGFTGTINYNSNPLKDTEGNPVKLQISDLDMTSAKITLPQNAAEGDVVSVGGLYANNVYTITLKESSWKWNGSKWETYTPPKNLGEMTIGEPSATAHAFNAFYLNVEGVELTDNARYDAAGTNNGIYLNGTKLNNSYIIDYGWVPCLYLKDDLTQEPAEDSVLTVKGTFSSANECFTVKEKSFKWNGTSWQTYIPLKNLGEMTIGEPSATAHAFNAFYLNVEGVELTDNARYDGDGANNGIYLNGTKLNNSYIIDYGWVPCLYLKDDLTQAPAEGSVLNVKGRFSSSSEYFTVQEKSFKWNGSTWVSFNPLTNLGVMSIGTPASEGNNFDSFYINTENVSIKANVGYYANDTASGIYLNDQKLSNSYIINYGWIPCVFMQDDIKQAPKADSILTIKGSFASSNEYFSVEETKYVWNGAAWAVYVDKIDLTVPTISLSDSTISWSAVPNATAYEIYANGEKKADTTETTYNLKNLKLGVGTYKITVKAVADNANPATSNEVSYSVTATKVQVSVATENTTYGSATVLYMELSNVSTSQKLKPVNGYVKLNGTELQYYVGEYSEVQYAINSAWGKVHVLQLQQGVTFGDKAILTIGGTFEGTDGTLIDIEETHLVCEMKKNAENKDVFDWTDVNLTMEGDLNGNGKWDVVDLIRMKRYIAGGIAKAYLNATDLNNNGTADEADVTILRKWMVGNTQMSDGQVTGKYLANKTINIFADGPVEQKVDSQLKQYFNAGFTTVLMTQDYVAREQSLTDEKGILNSEYVNAIKTAMKYGDVMVRNHGNKSDYFTANTFKQLYDLGVRQFYIWDEPLPHTNDKSANLTSVTGLAEAFNTLPEDTLFHVNLLPSYGPMKTTGWFWEEKLSHTGYVDEYANAISSNLKGQEYTVSVDNYPLLADGNIRKTYLTDLWTIANKAKALGDNATVNFCIQTYNEKGNTELRVPETRADISFQTNVGIALGAQSFEYFEYYDWSTDDDITGILTNGLYDEVKSVNRELLAWDHVFMAFDWQGIKTYNVGSSYVKDITQLSGLQKATVEADQATVVGEYKYTNGSDTDYGYMITNFTDPSKNTTDTVTVKVGANASVLVYRNGVGNYMTADENGKLTFELGAGEGVFVIVD